MKKSNVLLILALTIFLISFVSAKPATVTLISSNGVMVDALGFDSIPQNTNFNLDVHVYNISTGLNLTNVTTACYFHLYNVSGAYLLKQIPMVFDGTNDWSTSIKAGNFTSFGQYALEVWCTTGGAGGSERLFFSVTPDGSTLDTPTSIMYGLVFIGLLGLFIMFMGWASSAVDYGWKVGFVCGAYITTLVLAFLSWFVSSNYLYSLPLLSAVLNIVWIIMAILLPIFLILAAFSLIREQVRETEQSKKNKMFGAD